MLTEREARSDLCAWKHTYWLTGQKKSARFLCVCCDLPWTRPLVSAFLCSVLSVQSRCTETARTNRCSTAAPAGRRSTGSLSTGTGRRRLTPKTTHVSTVSYVLSGNPPKSVFYHLYDRASQCRPQNEQFHPVSLTFGTFPPPLAQLAGA